MKSPSIPLCRKGEGWIASPVCRVNFIVFAPFGRGAGRGEFEMLCSQQGIFHCTAIGITNRPPMGIRSHPRPLDGGLLQVDTNTGVFALPNSGNGYNGGYRKFVLQFPIRWHSCGPKPMGHHQLSGRVKSGQFRDVARNAQSLNPILVP